MKLALLGYGKMGKTIDKLASENGHTIVYTKSENVENGDINIADVAIEFSTPEAAVKNISRCFEKGIPVVCGTTGWLEHYPDIIKLCEACNAGFIYASNFSVGVNLFFDLNEHLAKLMRKWNTYVPEIEEIHHTQKKDAPSGTAITIAEGIIKNLEQLKSWKLNEKDNDSVRITAIREGDVKGTHSVDYVSEIDTISIKHEAHSRDGFALGAILAAEWLSGKKGVFTMKDVLGLE
jgi:4-hydroxy-tetrahydrodipicolinate reductase